MIRAIIFMAIGAYGMYLYQSQGTFDNIVDDTRSIINQTAEDIYNSTK